VATVLRTNELSIKVEPRLSNVNLSKLNRASAFYYNNLYMCAIPQDGSDTNNLVWVLDTRFGAWVYWTGISPNCFVSYIDSTGNESLYYGDEDTGELVEMFQDDRNDKGVAISVEWATKAFNQNQFNKEKRYFNPTFQFKDITSASIIKGYIYTDGVELNADFVVSQQNRSGGGFGAILVGETLLGDSPSTITTTEGSSDIPVEIYGVIRARSIKYTFKSSAINSYFKFLSVVHTYLINNKRLNDVYRYYKN
jgi:hypothetical protein